MAHEPQILRPTMSQLIFEIGCCHAVQRELSKTIVVAAVLSDLARRSGTRRPRIIGSIAAAQPAVAISGNYGLDRRSRLVIKFRPATKRNAD